MKAGSRPILVAAVPTPFGPDGDMDLPAAAKLFAAIDQSGVDALFVAGTTGEFLALTHDERLRLIEVALEVCTSARVVAHVGTRDGDGTAELVSAAVAAGAEQLAVVTPFGARGGADRQLDHFRAACEAADGVPVYAYVYPELTGVSVEPATMAALADIPGLCGAKVSSPGAEIIAGYSAVVPDDFTLLTGSDRDLAAAVRAGASGAVSGVSSALAEPFLQLISAIERADPDGQAVAQTLVEAAVAEIGPSVALLKLALEVRGRPGGPLRMAAAPPAPQARDRITALVQSLGAPSH
ncbi:dihydrodipicolinate synthase family protein [Streptomyces sp. NBC_00988]|uniref:dihydrodipicolinate synthase family protein n=1 Tax=Streptomyces sp. NBC_00988 TaxID=2903704 RepID=UPI00386F9C0B|nr:dihydrodipicolinate synthase family protein [Streptomyces sp. NBC_00988]